MRIGTVLILPNHSPESALKMLRRTVRSLFATVGPETQGNYRIPRLAMLCEGEDVCRVKSGSTYELSFWYKVDGTPANAGQFSVDAASASKCHLGRFPKVAVYLIRK